MKTRREKELLFNWQWAQVIESRLHVSSNKEYWTIGNENGTLHSDKFIVRSFYSIGFVSVRAADITLMGQTSIGYANSTMGLCFPPWSLPNRQWHARWYGSAWTLVYGPVVQYWAIIKGPRVSSSTTDSWLSEISFQDKWSDHCMLRGYMD